MWKGWITVLAGGWLILSGLLVPLQGPLNIIVLGVIVTVMGFTSLKSWHGFVAGIVGLWLIMSGAVITLWVPANFILSGTIVIILGGFILAHSVDAEFSSEQT